MIDDDKPYVRFENATLPDGGHAHLVMVASSGKASALALVRDAGRTSFVRASALFEADAILSPVGALLPMMSRKPLTDYAYNRFGVHDSPEAGAKALHNHLHYVRRALDGEGTFVRMFSREMAPPPPNRFLDLPYDFRNEGRPPAFVIQDYGPKPAPQATGRRGARAVSVPLTSAGEEMGRIERWLSALAEDFQPGQGMRLGVSTWSPEAVAYYAADGEIGSWRRQAGALQPAFARTIAHDPALRELVDAGKPFEGRLLDLIRIGAVDDRHLAPEDIAALTPAKLRRLRSFDLGVFGQGPSSHLALFRALSRLPLANVPDTPAGWRNFMRDGLGRLWELEVARIPLASAFRDVPRDWDLKALWPDHPEQEVTSVVMGIGDMAQRCADTLTRPFYGEIRARGVFHEGIARHLLFGSDSFAGMARRQREWHADLPRMAPVIDPHRRFAWPALFEPFVSDGIEIRCLTTSDELDAEGGKGPDELGMAGLDHCVGGYAASCYEGLSHVASVTGPGPDGAPVRLATLELVCQRNGIATRQLAGRGNASPGPEARRAVDALVTALNDGRHPHDRLAARHREPAPPPEPDDMDLQAVYEAWRPHLPRALHVADAEAFRSLLRDRIDALLGPEAPNRSALAESWPDNSGATPYHP